MQSWSYTCSSGFTLRGEHSPPSGKPLLHFIHGNGFCGRVYTALLQPLAEDFDLFLSDIQGHGDSDHGGRFRGWNKTADLCAEVWRAFAPFFGPVPVYGVGHSFGGVMTSLMLARHADLFERAVLLDPVLFTPPMLGGMALTDSVGLWRLNGMARRAHKRRDHWPDRSAAFAYFHQRGLFRHWQDASLQAYVDFALRERAAGGVELKCRPVHEAEIFASYPRRLWPMLAQIRQPVHILHGENSYPFVARSVEKWSAWHAGLSSARVPGGHCFMLEHPAETAARVKAALTGPEGGCGEAAC